VCAKANGDTNQLVSKKESITEIIQQILRTKQSTQFTKEDIELAIMKAQFVIDRRSINNWFNVLWKLQYLEQPQPGKYCLNVTEVANLGIL
jgi:hypothetical protein